MEHRRYRSIGSCQLAEDSCAGMADQRRSHPIQIAAAPGQHMVLQQHLLPALHTAPACKGTG
ncbi:hypothetical protein D3C74_477360 [compost metagenome]